MTAFRGLVVAGGLVAVLGVGAAPAGALTVTVGALHHQTIRSTVSGTVTGLAVSNDVGDIKIVPGSVTRIVAVEQYNVTAPTVTDTFRRGVLHIVTSCPSAMGPVDLVLNDCAVDLLITAPRAVSVDAVSDVGDVGVQGLRARTLTLRSTDGDVNAELAATPRSVVATTSEGDINMTLPSGAYAVDLDSRYGTARVRGITEQADARHTVRAWTSDGDIRLVGQES